jgi:two-component system chemotaxis response regulator CheY
MVVDDDAFVVAVYSSKLKKAGLEVEAVTNGAEALRRLDAVRPHLVILDLNMPRLHGIEVLKYIRNSPELATVPVIILSNVCSDEIMREAWAARPTRFFMKRETTPNTVIEEVQALLTQKGTIAQESPPRAAAVPPSASDATEKEEILTMEKLGVVLAQPETPEALQEALLNLYQVIQSRLRGCRNGRHSSLATLIGEALERLFEDLYAQPTGATPSSLRALAMGVERLLSLFAADGARPDGLFDPAMVLLASEDLSVRETLAQALHPPAFRPFRIGEMDVALALLAENSFDAIVMDVESEARWLKRVRALPGGRAAVLLFLVPTEDYRPSLVAGCERISKPVLAADLYLKALITIERRRAGLDAGATR